MCGAMISTGTTAPWIPTLLLRRSLGPYSKFIVTLRGVGYRFETP